MSDVSEAAIVRLLIADYVSADAVGKLNLIGGGLSVIGMQTGQTPGAGTGNTAPFGVVVSIAAEPDMYGSECAFELILEDSSGEQVFLPNPGGKGVHHALRFAHDIVFEEPDFPQIPGVPKRSVPARVQLVIMFIAGLPLTPGNAYSWRVKIDHDSHDDWTEQFYVPG